MRNCLPASFILFSYFTCLLPAYAQPLGLSVNSVESMVANSDCVVVAKITDFNLAEEVNATVLCRASIDIEETLKRRHWDARQKKLSVRLPCTIDCLADWKKRSSRLLVLLDDTDSTKNLAIELVPDKMEVITADLKLLRKPSEVIEAVRGIVGGMPSVIKRVHTFELSVPREIVSGTRMEVAYETGGDVTVFVPADNQLEKRAQDYIRSSNAQRRAEGVRALRYYKSDENIKVARKLLNDPNPTYVAPYYGKETRRRFFGVRYEAYETLKAWGINIEKPLTEDEVP